MEDIFTKASKLIRKELKQGDRNAFRNNDLKLIWHNIY